MARVNLFGLSIESGLPLPGWKTSRKPDVLVHARESRPDEQFADYETHVRDDGTIDIEHDGIAFRISGGAQIEVIYPKGIEQGLVTAWLTGVAFGALLLQRGRFPVHANAVVLPGRSGVAAFGGPSGAGKSTLAARFVAAGYELFCDDLLGVGFEDAKPVAVAGIPRLRLWQDSIDHLGLDRASAERIVSDVEKFEFALDPSDIRQEERPLERFYLLEKGDAGSRPIIERLTGAAAGRAVLDNAYRWRISAALHGEDWAFEKSLQIAREVEVYRFTRAWSLEQEADAFALIDEHLRT